MRRGIWEIRAIIEATEQEAHEAFGRVSDPDQVPGRSVAQWTLLHTRLDELDGADKAHWEAAAEQGRSGQETSWQRLYCEEAVVTGHIGRALMEQELPRVTVRLPKTLADQALASWERDYEESHDGPESYEQAAVRGRAGTLGLIGLSITESGRPDGDEIIVDLTSELIGNAVEAADHLPQADEI